MKRGDVRVARELVGIRGLYRDAKGADGGVAGVGIGLTAADGADGRAAERGRALEILGAQAAVDAVVMRRRGRERARVWRRPRRRRRRWRRRRRRRPGLWRRRRQRRRWDATDQLALDGAADGGELLVADVASQLDAQRRATPAVAPPFAQLDPRRRAAVEDVADRKPEQGGQAEPAGGADDRRRRAAAAALDHANAKRMSVETYLC